MQEPTIDPSALLTPNEVAEIFRVNPKTVTRWAQSGKISAIRTLGGHRRFNQFCWGEQPGEAFLHVGQVGRDDLLETFPACLGELHEGPPPI
jgi:excisionase family DNA binding protein